MFIRPIGKGGDSGFSGNIMVTVNEQESALLWLVETDSRLVYGGRGGSAGAGGIAGVGGKGGAGGRGGEGGRGYDVQRPDGTTDRGRNGPTGPSGSRGRDGK